MGASDPNLWATFLVRTLPGVSAERHAVWRATLAAERLTPSAWLRLPPSRRKRVAPLPDSAQTALERRLPEWKRLTADGGLGEALWLLCAADHAWPGDALACLAERAPDWLVGWGNAGILRSPLAAVVGSREATPEALQQAEIVARSLVELGMGVISGGAPGVDQVAHRAALRGGGSTVAVLAEGLAVSADFTDREGLDPGRTCLVSAVWPFQRWTTAEALARNRVVVALAQAVIVVAAQSRGGSLMTGETALALGKPTLTVAPEEVTVHTAGNRRLLQRGAVGLSAAAFTAGHAPAELRQALRRAAVPRPGTGDLFEDIPL